MKLTRIVAIISICCLQILQYSNSAEVLPDLISKIGNSLEEQFSKLFFESNTFLYDDVDKYPIPKHLIEHVNRITKLVPKYEIFTYMDKNHMNALDILTNILRDQNNNDELIKMAILLRDHPNMNQNLWLTAFMTSTLDQKLLRKFKRPNLLSLRPDWFINSKALEEFTRQSQLPLEQRVCIIIDGNVGSDNGPENMLWYFREDLLINAQHMFWHFSHPTMLNRPNGTITIDRNGELFYYLHHNILARYNAERFANGFSQVKPFVFEDDVIVKQGYNPHMSDKGATKIWGHRLPNTKLTTNLTFDINTVSTINKDIDSQVLIALNGSSISLNNRHGIDLLSDLIEASVKTLNKERYTTSGIHSTGHIILSELSIKGNAVMLEPHVSMRDPIFYEWHQYIENIFDRHKTYLTPYTPTEGEYPLLWSGIDVRSIAVYSQSKFQNKEYQLIPNELKTFMGNLTVELNMSGDINPINNTYEYCITRLDHDPFEYQIVIERSAIVTKDKATVRIFMAPRFNESGGRYNLNEQRQHFFAMDVFTVNLRVGLNIISRQSINSSLLMSWNLKESATIPNQDNPHCFGCGWPRNLLLPKGTTDGMLFDLFVMVTDTSIDTPEEEEEDSLSDEQDDSVCNMGHIICGVWNKKYPDVRPMGYPFDRKPFNISIPDEGTTRMVSNIEEYVSLIGNMHTIQTSTAPPLHLIKMGKEPQQPSTHSPPNELKHDSDFEEEMDEYIDEEEFEEEEQYTDHEEEEGAEEEIEEEIILEKNVIDEEAELKPKEFQIKRDKVLTFDNVNNLTNMLTKIKLVWPEDLIGYNETDFSTDPCRHGYPRSYYTCTAKEKSVLWHAENFRRQFIFTYPERRSLFIAPKNQCGVQKLFPTYISPATLRYKSFYYCESCVKYFMDFFTPEFMEPVNDIPKCIRSHDAIIKNRKANAYEFSILIVSLLIGAGWDAYVVDGYASKEFTTLCATVNYTDSFVDPIDYFGDKMDGDEKPKIEESMVNLGEVDEFEDEENKNEQIRPVSPSKYRVRFKKQFKSKYEETMEYREETRRQEEEMAAEKFAREEYLRNLPPPTPDNMLGFRTHAWILILPRKGDKFDIPFFLEPFTGTKREISDPGFTGIESVFNQKNFWANLQGCSAGCNDLSYDLSDGTKWGQFLVEPAWTKEKIKSSNVNLTDEDEEEEEENTRKVEMYLDMPVSWTKDVDIEEEAYDLKYPNGKKTFQFNDAIVELSSPFVNPDGLVRKVLKFNGKSRKTKNLIYIEERFMNRSDMLKMRKWFRKNRMLHEYFDKGRNDALKEHIHVSGKNKSYYPRHLYYYSNAQSENAYHRQVVNKGLIEHFENREDFLYYRFTAFGDVLCDTMPLREAKSKTKAFMDFVKGEGRKQRIRRKIMGIIEKFYRNPSKEIGEDISEKYILIDEGRFRISFHYGDEDYTRALLEFFKSAKGFQKETVDFKPEDSIEFRVDPFTPVLTNYKKYQFLKQLKIDQIMSSDMARSAEDEVFSTVNARIQEDWKHEIIGISNRHDQSDDNLASKALAEIQGDNEVVMLDFASPYLETGAPKNKGEELLLKKRIMEDAKARMARKIEHIKSSYAAESLKLKDLLLHTRSVNEDLAAQEHGLPSMYETTLTAMHIMEQRLVRLREKAPGDYCSLLIKVIQHPLLNRYAQQDRETKQLELQKGLEQLEVKKPVRRSCCTLNYFFKHKEQKDKKHSHEHVPPPGIP